jgi:hypothetical protein
VVAEAEKEVIAVGIPEATKDAYLASVVEDCSELGCVFELIRRSSNRSASVPVVDAFMKNTAGAEARRYLNRGSVSNDYRTFEVTSAGRRRLGLDAIKGGNHLRMQLRCRCCDR